ncbi:lysM and putative peptidoglycan-binding domain-containing protein 3 isoform X2 [Otolemur garnettii]|uniref:lysM and putative peptidoglycan-binding domain-containing protein 3 isoform X2 n=1 Tax=Otolemur garnettii TaxID=30611 RepID=UPI000C7F3F68|nr:lysM and putative peptidoglycan-binding domain-containing protein 3 isoform X2 [Otolemur garnettii]
MAGRHQNHSFPLPGVQSSGQIHAFGNCIDSDTLEEDAEVYELRSRGREKVRRSTSRDRLDDIIVLTKDIQEGDTLNAIALQYCCTFNVFEIGMVASSIYLVVFGVCFPLQVYNMSWWHLSFDLLVLVG